MKLPPKPSAVAHVSDAHWEAALDPIEDAINAVWDDNNTNRKCFRASCRKHFVGLTFPVQS